mmetsp:Transcript_43636/g.138287  ORF Transcript_43636/g.138287 Transcript_43636/m.138287 type:complete len:216 (-) Transcript_43636:51-698(-)
MKTAHSASARPSSVPSIALHAAVRSAAARLRRLCSLSGRALWAWLPRQYVRPSDTGPTLQKCPPLFLPPTQNRAKRRSWVWSARRTTTRRTTPRSARPNPRRRRADEAPAPAAAPSAAAAARSRARPRRWRWKDHPAQAPAATARASTCCGLWTSSCRPGKAAGKMRSWSGWCGPWTFTTATYPRLGRTTPTRMMSDPTMAAAVRERWACKRTGV